MKHLITALFVLAMTGFAQSQSSSEFPERQTFEYESNIIKINALALFGGVIDVSYERVLQNNTAVLGSAGYTFGYLGENVDGFQFGGEFRLYLSGKRHNAPRGWHLGAVVNYAHAKNLESQLNVNALGTGFGFGYQWVWSSGLTLDLGLAPQYFTTFDYQTDKNTFIVPAQVSIGYNF
jgi:hypothetical protein